MNIIILMRNSVPVQSTKDIKFLKNRLNIEAIGHTTFALAAIKNTNILL